MVTHWVEKRAEKTSSQHQKTSQLTVENSVTQDSTPTTPSVAAKTQKSLKAYRGGSCDPEPILAKNPHKVFISISIIPANL